MKHFSVPVTSAVALAAVLAISSASAAPTITPPAVPEAVEVPAGHEAFFMGHASGTQNYMCLPAGLNAFDWTLITPRATLFNDSDKQVATHYFSPNPLANSSVEATWLHSRDSSTVWGVKFGASSDPEYVEPDAIPWLLIWVTGREAGPAGGDTLAETKFIQRVNTTGGLKPTWGCFGWDNVGAMQYVPYTADYYFYRVVAE